MEKKGNRNLPSSSRGSGADLKKVQDVATGKSWPRGTSRRREPSCGFPKAEPLRKPQPQRTKSSDKRPKPRGFYYTGAISRNETSCLEGYQEPELGSVFSPGSKKQSLNHLLNFSYAPRESYQPERVGSKQGGKLLMTKKHKYNKEHFLQANCQFIVNEKGDYSQYMNNPDALVGWELIEQVNVQVSETPSCPICLYPPKAAKMTKCGHVYCWSCILHYLALSDKQWRTCPICFDAIQKDDLKSVIAIPHSTFNINEIITFKLMKRQRGSLTAYPADAEAKLYPDLFNMSDKNTENCYSKLLLATKENILEIIDRESTELEVQLIEVGNCPEKCFVEQAVELLNARRSAILKGTDSGKEVDNIKIDDELSVDFDLGSLSLEPEDTSEVNEKLGEIGYWASLVGANRESSVLVDPETVHLQAPKFHYFYQAADGQHIYLHAINARMLEHTYGSLEFGPKTLTGKILEKEGGSMTEDLRKKLRYLQHLPVTCQFEVAEIRLTEPVIKRDTFDHFKEQIEIRKKKRQRRAREEKRREKRIEAEENGKIGKFTAPNLHLESRDHFPDVSESHLMFPELESIENRSRTESECSLPIYSEQSSSFDAASVSNLSLEGAYAGPSFATMLATKKKPSVLALRPAQSNPATAPSPVKLINVTGSKMTGASVRTKSHRFDSDNEPEEYEPVPVFSTSFGEAFALALSKSDKDFDNNESMVSGKKKKKRTKQTVLFSTHMACTGK